MVYLVIGTINFCAEHVHWLIAEEVADGPFTKEEKRSCVRGLIENPASGLSVE